MYHTNSVAQKERLMLACCMTEIIIFWVNNALKCINTNIISTISHSEQHVAMHFGIALSLNYTNDAAFRQRNFATNVSELHLGWKRAYDVQQCCKYIYFHL